ncbi:phage major capsid protein [Cryobacterium zongtaii]|uniref:Phage major capsid protein n=1 Tax=Cryobacterium zongtaii TaxID=1259217 RepID=A0A2S3ZKU7_9MICO|nr:phage major capsid protein [Cryobacterium zongtaii]POH68974.1 phage major capsid protein [Cryobacterium zongtaii]
MATELRQKRDTARSNAEVLLHNAKVENRDLTSAEARTFDGLSDSVRSLNGRLEQIQLDEDSSAAAEAAMRSIMGQSGGAAFTSAADRELAKQFRGVIRSRSFEPIEVHLADDEMRSGFQPGIEQRDLSTSSGGGLLGTTFFNRLQRHMVESSSVLAAGATVLQTSSGEPLKVPKTTALSTAAIVPEAGTIPESDPTLGAVTFGAYKYGFLVQVSYELAEDEKFDLVGYLAEQAGIAVGNAFGAHAITGTGTGQPRGILTDATLGVTGPTGTATTLGTQTTAGQGGDLLLDLAASVAEPYARSAAAAWLMRGTTLNTIRKLRDSTGRYIFSTDIIPGSGSAGTLLGRPVFTDPTMPAMAAGAKSIAFGDLSRYWVRQVNGVRFERSNEFAFDKDLVTFRCLARIDGALTDTTGAVKYFAHSAT